MQGHFTEHLKVRDLLLAFPPDHILELGALDGDNTAKLLSLRNDIPGLKVTVLTDGKPTDPVPQNAGLTWVWGISWVEMPAMPPATFGAVIIDTDHNYWTMKQELSHCPRILKAPGWIIMHDTFTFGGKNGYANTYKSHVTYPYWAVREQNWGIVSAVQDFLKEHPEFQIVAQTEHHHGAMALRRTA